MQNDVSRFVANIIPLQNIQTNVTGLDKTSVLSNQVVAIRQMINTDTKSVFTDNLASFSGGSIAVNSPLTVSNVGSTQLVNGGTSLSVNDYLNYTSSIMNVVAASSTIMNLTTGGLSVQGSGTFQGICYATQFVTLSDMMAKSGVREWRSPVLPDLQSIKPYVFKYNGMAGEDIGLMAQEVEAVWPLLVKEGVKGKYVNYDGVVVMLLKAVKELAGRVSTLEGV
jgi:hypothetical protein